MRKACLLTVLCLLCACSDDDAERTPSGAAPDAGTKVTADAGKGKPDSGTASAASALRPELPRPPKGGLPAELRPPR